VGAFFQEFIIPSATGRKRTVSIKTEELYVVQMQVMVRQLSNLNMPLKNLGDFSTRHVHALTRHYESQGLSSSSLQKKNTVLRRFGTWIGKPDMTPRLADMVVDPTRAKRSYSALESKAWTSNGVDPEEVIRLVEAESMVTGLQMRIQHAFGLRPREVVMLKPQTADQGRGLFVTDGTKGGRARMVPIDSPLKRSLIEKAKVYAATNPRGVLTDRLQPMHKAINRYYYIAKKAGVGKNGLGITLHGLRHEFANNVFKEITGVNSPVNGGRVEDPELLRKAMQETSNQLGHSRLHAGSAYLGSNRHINYTQFKNIRYITATIEGSASVIAAVRLAGPSTWWVTGAAAQGNGIRGGVQLTYRAAVNPGEAQDEADMAMGSAALAVALAVGKALGVMANVLPDSALDQSGHMERLELIGLWRESLDPSGAAGNEASTSKSFPTAAPAASAEETGLFDPNT
jgi:integrase